MIFVWTYRRINNDVHLCHPSIVAEFMWMLCWIWCLCGVWDYVWAMWSLNYVEFMFVEFELCLCHVWVLWRSLSLVYICYGALFSHICVKIIICELLCVLSVKCRDFCKNSTNLGHMVTLPWQGTRQRPVPCGCTRQRPHVATTCATWHLSETIWSLCRVHLTMAHGRVRSVAVRRW